MGAWIPCCPFVPGLHGSFIGWTTPVRGRVVSLAVGTFSGGVRLVFEGACWSGVGFRTFCAPVAQPAALAAVTEATATLADGDVC